MVQAIICREMGWTWEEYQKQPAWFIDNLLLMFNAEAVAQNKKL